MAKRNATLVLVGLAALFVVFAAAGAVLSHDPDDDHGEERAAGPYVFVWGAVGGSVVTDAQTWMQLQVSDRGTGDPVTGAEEGLEVAFELNGEQSEFVSFTAVHGEDGVYRVPVTFTEPGEYMVHLEGEIDGNTVHTHFAFTVGDGEPVLRFP